MVMPRYRMAGARLRPCAAVLARLVLDPSFVALTQQVLPQSPVRSWRGDSGVGGGVGHGRCVTRRHDTGSVRREESWFVRIVVFTADPRLERTPWWHVLMQTRGLTAVLVCRQLVARHPRAVW